MMKKHNCFPVGASVWTLASASLLAHAPFSCFKNHCAAEPCFPQAQGRLSDQQSKNEHGRTTSQSSARDGQQQTHAAKCARNRTPPEPEGTTQQERQTSPGRASAPPPEVEDMPRSDHIFHSAREVELRYQQDEFDASRSWSAQERVIFRYVEDSWGKAKMHSRELRSWRLFCSANRMDGGWKQEV